MFETQEIIFMADSGVLTESDALQIGGNNAQISHKNGLDWINFINVLKLCSVY